ncbi:MAG: BON domain-containing protein [Desulfotignum sp.]
MTLYTRKNTYKYKNTWVMVAVFILAMAFPSFGGTEANLSDAAVENAVERQLMTDQAIPAYRITAECADGVVSLTGTVGNLLAKDRALENTETVKGVRSVINLIEVSPFQEKSDARLQKDAVEALRLNPVTRVFDITVAVNEKRAILTGKVTSYREKQLAETVVKGVSGIQSLENNISISYPAQQSDGQILAEIEQGLLWDALVDHQLIQVQVKNGKVTLTGTIGSAAEKTRAISDSWVAGVKAVDASDLTVARWVRDDDLRATKYVPRSDGEIKNAVMLALAKDPRISADAHVKVMVQGGTVTLKGSVDYLQARRAAAQDAGNTVGVLRVRNHLKVAPLPVAINDRELAQNIEDTLDRDAYVEGYDIQVNVRSGVAELYGKVTTYFEKMRAENLASTIAGIYFVNNYIAVARKWSPYHHSPFMHPDNFPGKAYEWYSSPAPSSQNTDRQIREDIKEEIRWSPFVDEEKVDVSVDNGRATLTGTVNSRLEHDAAIQNAREGGAGSVNNQLKISPLLPPKKN